MPSGKRHFWPQDLLDEARPYLNERKLRLISCAYAREQILHLTREVRELTIHMAEKFIAEEIDATQLEEARDDAAQLVAGIQIYDLDPEATRAARFALATTHEDAYTSAYLGTMDDTGRRLTDSRERVRKRQLIILRDLVEGEILEVPIDPMWLLSEDGVVKRLAASVYVQRSWDAMPILADALEDVGCTDERILTHCREQGEHFRGCWVLDHLLFSASLIQ